MLVTPEVGYRLASLADGEGCFHIGKRGKNYMCSFIITLRQDDAPLLRIFQEATGVGSMYFRPASGNMKPKVRWEVHRKKEVLALAGIFDAYPLWSKKATDFTIWREAVHYWNNQRWGFVDRKSVV